MSHKKLFRAIDSDTLEVLFIGKYDPIPNGWYETREEAKGAIDTDADVTDTMASHDTPKRRGRPRKVDVVSTAEV